MSVQILLKPLCIFLTTHIPTELCVIRKLGNITLGPHIQIIDKHCEHLGTKSRSLWHSRPTQDGEIIWPGTQQRHFSGKLGASCVSVDHNLTSGSFHCGFSYSIKFSARLENKSLLKSPNKTFWDLNLKCCN